MKTATAIEDVEQLRELVLATAVAEPDPYRVAQIVLGQLDTVEELRVVAEASFASWVWETLKRPHAPRQLESAPMPTPTVPEQSKAPVMQERGFPACDGGRRVSRKVDGLVAAYTRKLNQAVKVSEERGFKRLRDCTVDDLWWMVEYRRKVAAQNEGAAMKYEKLLQAMMDSGAVTVAELDRAVGESILLG